MSDALESELDALFQLPPAEMVAARNALVARLKKAGERDAAARVKALKRPAPAAWAINQCFFRERALLEAALADVARVRELQATDGVDRQQLAAAVAAQRASLQAIVDAALRYCAGAGLPTGGIQERRVFATVHGWLGGSGVEAPGRMTEELEPSGFEGLGQLGTPSPLPASTTLPQAQPMPAPARAAAPLQPSAASASQPQLAPLTAKAAQRPSPPPAAAAPQQLQLAPDAKKKKPGPVSTKPVLSAEEQARRSREQAEARVREHKQAAAWAGTRLADRREKLAIAEQAVDRALREVEDAERALKDRRARLQQKQQEHTQRHADLQAAERAHQAAETALAEARAELAKL